MTIKSANPETVRQIRSAPIHGIGHLATAVSTLNGKAERLALSFILLLHIGATCIFFPPWEVLRSEPLFFSDYSINTHRVYMYRQGLAQSGLPWGYNPAISGGVTEDPFQDVGAKSMQVVGAFFPFLSSGMVVRLFTFTVVLTFPIWTFLTCRHLGLPLGAQAWVLVTLLIPAWLYKWFAFYFLYGVVCFAAASYFTPYVLVLFLDFITRPWPNTYLAFILALAFLFFLHILGPMILLPPMVFYTLITCPLAWSWRIVALLSPLIVLVLNAFWVVPGMLAFGMPRPPWSPILWGDLHLTYSSWAEIGEGLLPFRLPIILCSLSLAVYGITLLRKFADRFVCVSFALATVFGLFLHYFGSFLPIVVRMQPNRFILPTFVLLALPVGVALRSLVEKIQLPAGLSAGAVACLVAAIALLLGKPDSLPLPPSPNLLGNFVTRRTTPAERLLVQTRGYYEPKVFPLAFGREVIGNTFNTINDPAQFLRETLWGKKLNAWTPEELRSTLERWGVTWIFTCTKEARMLFVETTGSLGEKVGKYYAFRMPGPPPTRFLIGTGQVVAKVNRFELTDLNPRDGLIVLRYRYHPAWQTTPYIPVYQYPIPEDPVGFIALKNPPETATLDFSPWAILHVPWPQNPLLTFHSKVQSNAAEAQSSIIKQ